MSIEGQVVVSMGYRIFDRNSDRKMDLNGELFKLFSAKPNPAFSGTNRSSINRNSYLDAQFVQSCLLLI